MRLKISKSKHYIKLTSAVAAIKVHDMDAYCQCNACGHQWHAKGSIQSTACQKCGQHRLKIEAGFAEPPAWWRSETPEEFVNRTTREMRGHLAKWNQINLICWLVVGLGTGLGLLIAGLWCSLSGGC